MQMADDSAHAICKYAQGNSLKEIEAKFIATGDTQISLTDPDARSMITRGGGIVGHNEKTVVDAKHHFIVEHEVTKSARQASDKLQLQGTYSHAFQR